jgi:hypothetical protein
MKCMLHGMTRCRRLEKAMLSADGMSTSTSGAPKCDECTLSQMEVSALLPFRRFCNIEMTKQTGTQSAAFLLLASVQQKAAANESQGYQGPD